MATPADPTAIELPSLPAKHGDFIQYLKDNRDKSMTELMEPYKQYDNEMRKVFAQQPNHAAAENPSIVPIFSGHEGDLRIRARDTAAESEETKASYIMPLDDEQRRLDGSPAVVSSLKDFRTNFNLFSESSLVDLDWSNVVAAGSAVVTSLLAVPDKYSGTKRALREYYHEQLAPASDVDLFLYGLTEVQATAKIAQIEASIRDAILTETTTVRTKNAITIVSQHPTRHVQVVLRIYKSISEILTGFDVDCSCAAYDGKQVYASPRAIAAFITQINTIDLTRRSPSYESRLSKYAHRGFEIFWPELDRSRIDPTIFERSFGRTEGLARLLILEKLPKSLDRDAYLDQRRAERGRPTINRWRSRAGKLHGNIKDSHEDEVADWVNAEDVSDYHTFTIPYGPKFHARKIEKLLFTKDMLLNAEWNRPKDRQVNLHRHPAFFGRADDVFHDCCGSCPQPKTAEEEEAYEEETKVYVSGEIEFIKDDPGRQAIGSFHPITPAGWTEMAYVGNTARLCQAIVEHDVEYVRAWLEQDGNDPNTRDYTGRTPLHLAVSDSSPEVVRALVDNGARLVARLVDGKTALHLAAMRGNIEIISTLLRQSEANEEEEEKKADARRALRAAAGDYSLTDAKTSNSNTPVDSDGEEEDSTSESDGELVEHSDEDSIDATTENSMVRIKPPSPDADDKALEGDDKDEPDVYDVNVLAWDAAVSPLHLAIVNGHTDAVRCLVADFGADVLLPIKLFNDHDKSARAAILTLVLALQLPVEQAKAMTQVLIQLGASTAQADMDQNTTLQYSIVENPSLIETLTNADQTGVSRALNHLSVSGYKWSPVISSPLLTAIASRDSLTALRLLGQGAKSEIDFGAYMKAYQTRHEPTGDSKHNKEQFQKSLEQPVVCAVQCELPHLAAALVEQHGADPNTLSKSGWTVLVDEWSRNYNSGYSLLDEVQKKIKELSEWKPKEKSGRSHKPIPLQSDSTYLSGLEQGSYALWSAQKQLNEAKEKYQRDLKTFQDTTEQNEAKEEKGESKQKAAIDAMLGEFKALKKTLLEQGAKTFKELYPDIEEAKDQNRWHGADYTHPGPKAFKLEFNFQLPDVTDETQERYVQLFESAWKGDLKTIKELTLLPWKSSDGDDRPPLQIAVQDQHSFSPFSIAVLHGHLDLATAIMEIAKAQYAPPDAPKPERHRLVSKDDDEDDDSNSDDSVRIVSELVDETFTVETVGQVSTQTKSRVTPLEMMLWWAPSKYFGKHRSLQSGELDKKSAKAALDHLSEEKREKTSNPGDLLEFAIHTDNGDLLEYLLSLGEQYTKAESSSDTEGSKQFFAVPDMVHKHAMEVDRPHLLSKLIKRTGAGLPMEHLIKQSGIEVKEKSQYYQGLSVYGKKRKDWAARGKRYRRNYSRFSPLRNSIPPLLQAAFYGSVETVEWLLSDAPIRCYNEFAKANSDDERVKLLSEAPGGFEGCVRQFLDARSHLVMHCVVMGTPTPEASALIHYLIKTLPECIDAKSQDLLTPLHAAFRKYRVEAAKILIEAGADQTVRDKDSNNIIHHLLVHSIVDDKGLEELSLMLELVDKRVLPDLFLQRCTDHPGSLTPLAQFVNRAINSTRYGSRANSTDYDEVVLRAILKFSNGAELNSINGEGHTPLHVAVRENNEVFTKTILEQDPTLLLRENATGRTPFEMAEDVQVASLIGNPPALPHGDRAYSVRRNRHQSRGICDREPEEFLEKSNDDADSPKERIWNLLKDTRAKLRAEGHAQRRLVTLNEANEVAKRLAATKAEHAQRYRGREEVEDEEEVEEPENTNDEVQIWLQ